MRPDPRQVAIALAGLCAFYNLYAPQSVLPLLSEQFSASAARTGLTITATTFAIALVAPFIGAVADVLGRKRLIVTAMLALTIPSIGIALAPSLDVMIGWRFLTGLLLPPVFAVAVTYIGEEWPPAEATTVTGFYFSAGSFGGFLGRFLTGVIADWYGWRAAFLVEGAITLACAIGVIMLLTRERKFVPASNLAAARRQMLQHLRNPQLIATCLIGAGVLFNFVSVFTYASFLLAGPPFSLSPALVGSIFVVYLAGSITTPLTGRFVRRFGRRNFVLSLIAIWACGLLLTLTPSLPLTIAAFAAMAGTGFLCQASATSYVAISAKEGSSTAVGLYVTFFYVGGSLGAALGGVAWGMGAWPGVIALSMGVLGVMALLVGTVWPRHAT